MTKSGKIKSKSDKLTKFFLDFADGTLNTQHIGLGLASSTTNTAISCLPCRGEPVDPGWGYDDGETPPNGTYGKTQE